jgi:hypothetical protein
LKKSCIEELRIGERRQPMLGGRRPIHVVLNADFEYLIDWEVGLSRSTVSNSQSVVALMYMANGPIVNASGCLFIDGESSTVIERGAATG